MKSNLDELASILRNKYGLSSPELRILGLLIKGATRKEIADNLNLSVHTVDTHLTSGYRKLGVRNEAEAVGRVLAHLIPPVVGNVLC